MNSSPILRKGDSVFLISPSYSADKQDIHHGIKALISNGLQVESGRFIFNSWGSFAGTDNERLIDLQDAIDSDTAKAIICIRGGYGISRLIHLLNWEKFVKNPKWLIGFSDITLLHLQIQQFGLRSIHGLMAARFTKPEHKTSFENLFKLLFDLNPDLKQTIQPEGTFRDLIEGEIIGGNLTMLAHSMGTAFEPTFSGKILFLEEVGEPFYKIDRMIYQLKLAGKTQQIKAIVLGQFTDCKNLGFPLQLNEIFKSAFPETPIFSGLQSGHGEPNFPLILGEIATIRKEGNNILLEQLMKNKQLI